jgi:hypothetical protein
VISSTQFRGISKSGTAREASQKSDLLRVSEMREMRGWSGRVRRCLVEPPFGFDAAVNYISELEECLLREVDVVPNLSRE